MGYGILIRWGFALAMAALVCGGLVKCGYERGVSAGEAKVRAVELKQAKADAKAAQDSQRAAEANAAQYRQRSEAQEVIAEQYLQGLNDANDRADRTTADLRAGYLKLRKQWRCPEVPASEQSPASSGAPDDAADLRAADIGRVHGIGLACNAQVKGLQAILIEERK